jgi:hypothetical protein
MMNCKIIVIRRSSLESQIYVYLPHTFSLSIKAVKTPFPTNATSAIVECCERADPANGELV